MDVYEERGKGDREKGEEKEEMKGKVIGFHFDRGINIMPIIY